MYVNILYIYIYIMCDMLPITGMTLTPGGSSLILIRKTQRKEKSKAAWKSCDYHVTFVYYA